MGGVRGDEWGQLSNLERSTLTDLYTTLKEDTALGIENVIGVLRILPSQPPAIPSVAEVQIVVVAVQHAVSSQTGKEMAYAIRSGTTRMITIVPY